MTVVRKITVDELSRKPNIVELLDAYAAESSISGMPAYNAQMDTYRALENAQLLHLFGSYSGEILTGFLCMLSTFIPHYGVNIATTESYFVAQEHRNTGAGLKLLRHAEEFAKTLGVAGFFVSAPKGGKLADVMSAMPAYRETNRVFFRRLSDV